MIGSLVLSVLLLGAQEEPDRVHLLGGSVLLGRVLEMDADGVTLELTPEAPPLVVRWAQMAAPGLVTTRKVVVTLRSGDRLSGSIGGAGASGVSLLSPLLGKVEIPLADLAAGGVAVVAATGADLAPAVVEPPTPPPWKAFDDKDWSGKVRLGGTFTTGNVDSSTVDFLTEVTRQWERDRLLGVLRLRYGEVDGELAASFGLIGTKFEHYLEPDLYLYANSEISRDEVQNLDFRALLGIGVGYMVWKESADEMLALEAGVTALYEQFDGFEGELDPALRLALDYRDVFFEKAKFYQRLELLTPLSDPADFVLRSSTGFGYPLGERWSLDNRLDIVYLGQAPAGTQSLDVVLTVGIEYVF